MDPGFIFSMILGLVILGSLAWAGVRGRERRDATWTNRQRFAAIQRHNEEYRKNPRPEVKQRIEELNRKVAWLEGYLEEDDPQVSDVNGHRGDVGAPTGTDRSER